MQRHALLINDDQFEYVVELLKSRRIDFTVPGYYGGKVVIHELYESKMNFKESPEERMKVLDAPKVKVPTQIKATKKKPSKVKSKSIVVEAPAKELLAKYKAKKDGEARNDHRDMVKFAKQLGYKDISHAIREIGSGANFRRRFKAEFQKA